jgi:hypothetical protein
MNIRVLTYLARFFWKTLHCVGARKIIFARTVLC